MRRAITKGEETTPKSHHAEVLPLCERMAGGLERARAERKSPWAAVALTAYGKPWGEYGLHQAFKRAQKRAGKSGWSVHRLRHFFVTELFRNGVSAVVVQRLVRHSDLATTQRYADVDANDLRSAIERLDGNGVETSTRDRKG